MKMRWTTGLVAVALAGALHGGERALYDTARSPHAKLYAPDLGDVHWTSGLWADRFAACRTTMAPHLWEIFQSPKDSHAWANFLIAAGEGQGLDGKHGGPPFADGDFFKWFEATAQIYALDRDPKLDALMDRIIAVVAKAQQPDGYLGTDTTIRQRLGTGPGAFAVQDDFEAYNLGHLMTAACVHYRATGKTTLLGVATKAADFLVRFADRSPLDLTRSAVCPAHFMGLVELYRTTGDARYLKLAQLLIDDRGQTPGTDQNQDRIPFRQMTRAVGHAVRANYLYAGAADVYAETGDRSLETTLGRLANDVAGTKLYITGATGALYDGASPDGSATFSSIQLVHQAYGRDYQLPNLSAYNESCATVGFMLWNWRMLLATGNARYADLFEQAMYNGLLAAISLDGEHYFYVNPLRKLKADGWPMRWSRTRQPNIQLSFCCPPNVVRTIAEAQDYAYGFSDGALWVNLYGASELDSGWKDGKRVKLRQETEYPWNGKVRLVVDAAPGGDWTLRLRIPGWCEPQAVSLTVNGAPAGEPQPGRYAEVARDWKAGDVVELNLNFKPEFWQANPLVEETAGQAAVRLGPVVYCLESADLPAGAGVEQVRLRGDAGAIRQRRESIGGQSLVTLRMPGVLALAGAWKPGELYRPGGLPQTRPITVKLVPYFAWGNRGDGDMSVWLPLR